MTSVLQLMIDKYTDIDTFDRKMAIKEVMQETVLYCLSRAGFFEEAAFYGGTALRIFYGLDRFSEDLDFSLLKVDKDFNLEKYFPAIKDFSDSVGINVDIISKKKRIKSDIKSAFLKADSIEHMLIFYPGEGIEGTRKGDLFKVKFEVDSNPPVGATYEVQYKLLPYPYQVLLFDQPSLFAGKIHAILCRSWKDRVKGRDLYDFVFYIGRGTPVNIKHVYERLIQTGYNELKEVGTIESLISFLVKRFSEIDYDEAKLDVRTFIKNQDILDIWGKEFFISLALSLKGQ